MKLRNLQVKDAERMLEWMKDEQVNQYFRFSTDSVTLDTVTDYIIKAQQKNNEMHFAVVDDNDLYLGTISLKDINKEYSTAEYAISLHKDSHGTGVATLATSEILRIAFLDLNLNKVYLNVLTDNTRANRFYEKYGFKFEGEFLEHYYIKGKYRNLKWYRLLKDEYLLIVG